MSALKDLTGQRFGRLVVVERAGSDTKGNAMWKCQCDCGEVRVVNSRNLLSGNSKSCGCLKTDQVVLRNIIHGKRKSRLYPIWKAMNERCRNPNVHNYHRYGGRGITVCEEWKTDFQAFYSWAMANGYDENAPVGKCTIDRIDNDKGYSPDNCRWVDTKTQNNNKSNNGKDSRK